MGPEKGKLQEGQQKARGAGNPAKSWQQPSSRSKPTGGAPPYTWHFSLGLYTLEPTAPSLPQGSYRRAPPSLFFFQEALLTEVLTLKREGGSFLWLTRDQNSLFSLTWEDGLEFRISLTSEWEGFLKEDYIRKAIQGKIHRCDCIK